ARNSKLYARNSKLYARNSKLYARNSKLYARNSKLYARNSKSCVRMSLIPLYWGYTKSHSPARDLRIQESQIYTLFYLF
ncbi:MAG: hypothetical protein SVZ03_04330, partial [Spirochaetota bacterium]|nr:hypothetical protein [Spirochaetota bacterium]